MNLLILADCLLHRRDSTSSNSRYARLGPPNASAGLPDLVVVLSHNTVPIQGGYGYIFAGRYHHCSPVALGLGYRRSRLVRFYIGSPVSTWYVKGKKITYRTEFPLTWLLLSCDMVDLGLIVKTERDSESICKSLIGFD